MLLDSIAILIYLLLNFYETLYGLLNGFSQFKLVIPKMFLNTIFKQG